MITFYKNIIWRSENHPDRTLNYWLGNHKGNKMKKVFASPDRYPLEYGIQALDLDALEEFYHQLYVPYISKKKNSNVINLLERLQERIIAPNSKEELYYASIKQHNQCIAGGIFIKAIKEEKTILTLGYRAYQPEVEINTIRIGNYIEYLFFHLGKELNIDLYSRGMDRNGYGGIGSNIGLALHKLEQKFIPKMSHHHHTVKINTSDIDTTTLIFTDPDNEGLFTKAILYYSALFPNLEMIQQVFDARKIALILH